MSRIKNTLLFIVVLLFLFSNANAQTIRTRPKAELNEILSTNVGNLGNAFSKKQRILVDVASKPVVIKKETDFEPLAFANTSRDIDYQGYIVFHKKKYYFVAKDFVIDNSLIDSANNELSDQYRNLKKEIERVKQLSHAIDSLNAVISDNDKFYSGLRRNLNHSIDSVKKAVGAPFDERIQAAEQHVIDSLNAVDQKWFKSLPISSQNAIKAIDLKRYWLSDNNSVGGHDAYIEYVNLSNKTIKYFHWVGRAKNAVDDYVNSTIGNESSFKCKETGPIRAGATGGGTWENVIYNWSAEYLVITSITIEYLDGTKLSINSKGIADIEEAKRHNQSDKLINRPKGYVPRERQFVRKLQRPIEKQKEEAINAAITHLSKDLDRVNQEGKVWENRKKWMEEGKYDMDRVFFTPILNKTGKSSDEIDAELKAFKAANFID